MSFTANEVQANRDYFAAKLHSEKGRAQVLKAVEGTAPYDFVLLDTRGKGPFAEGHIPGAWCMGEEDIASMASLLPKDKEIVTYCWGHD